MKKTLFAMSLLLTLTGCSPEVGSDAWCKGIAEKPKGDITASEAADYAKNCVFNTTDE